MNFDDMLKTWHAQEEKPLYDVNQNRLQLVLQHEQAGLRRQLRVEHWVIYGVSTFVLAWSAVLLWAFIHYGGTAWDVLVAAAATAAALAGGGGVWLSRNRQARRERGFGNSLREEIRRNLSLLDYQLSRKGRTERALLGAVPISLAGMLVYWLVVVRINHNPLALHDVVFLLCLLVTVAVSAIAKSRAARRGLLPRRLRLSELLEMLNKSE